jgi:glycine dehydrogenase
MLQSLDPPVKTLDAFVKEVLPADILSETNLFSDTKHPWELEGETEQRMVTRLKDLSRKNQPRNSFIGCGYTKTLVPEVIKRNVLENPAWYTSYTPYQAEISQGRLESLLNFQTLTSDLTGLPIANASVLDEPTAAAEAMTMSMNSLSAARLKKPNKTFIVSHLCHPQTIAVLNSRAEGFGINIKAVDVLQESDKLFKDPDLNVIGVLVQYPDTEGGVNSFQSLADSTHEQGALFCVATDLLALTLLKAPGEFGADIAFGSAQRFGVPMGSGGPHAAFFACSEKLKRKIPGRLVGISKDRLGNRALRLALQTREQHIRREKATSNICTAQALLANMSAFYAIYHGPHGLKAIAERVVLMARMLQQRLHNLGFEVANKTTNSDGRVLFDTLVFQVDSPQTAQEIFSRGEKFHLNFRRFNDRKIGITVDEATTIKDLARIACCFNSALNENTNFRSGPTREEIASVEIASIEKENVHDLSMPADIRRTSSYLTHPVFNTYHSETGILRYMYHLQSKDLSLVHSMIPLGSCTMKLNATAEMVSLSMPGFSSMHPFAPPHQQPGYATLIAQLTESLKKICGMASVSFQPNSGAQGEFAGLRVIRKYQMEHSSGKRDVCLIPLSAHGTNPASAAMAGMKVVPLKCENDTGNLDMEDLKAKCEQHKDSLAAIMITYPSTFGVFEPKIKEVCDVVHQHGGQVYMDGANLNAQIGLCSPGEIGADVCHLNLHKTFCIPHGGGGPGVGPIAVKEHLAPYLPGHPLIQTGGEKAIDPVNGAPFGSASILPISYAYIKMMGGKGLTHATKITLLNANYILSRLKPHYPILYTNSNGRCAHEFILDARKFKESAGIEAIDIAKRLQDYGFHAPTMSWPVANTLMIEPTESENQEELDRFCDALISIREEIAAIEKGEQPREGNVMKMSPHTQADLMRNDWDRVYSRETAAYPLPWLREKKFWPTVTRVDDGKNHSF